MTQVYSASLKPASGGFGEYDWTEAVRLEGCEDFLDYEAGAGDTLPLDQWLERTEEISGRIHDERGRVYKVMRDGETLGYEMVWVEEQESQAAPPNSPS